MKVCMDGLRRNMARAYTKAVSEFRFALSAETHWDKADAMSELGDALAELRGYIGGFMCVYSENPEDEMSNLGDESDLLPWPNPEDEE